MKKQYFFIALFLLICLLIYLFYRTDKTVVNEVVIRAISWDTYLSLRDSVKRILPLNEFIIYSLPEGLWAFCITLTSLPYYLQVNKSRIDCKYIPLVWCVGLEIAQLFHVTNGRFDPMDISVTVIFWMIALLGFDGDLEKQHLMTPINGRRMLCFLTYGIIYLAHVAQ